MTAEPVDIKVLVIDDSAWSRQTITATLESAPGIRVVARAGDGDEGLKQVFAHSPDIITLDLDMPRMDGFTFLRILMSRRPTPVIVISSHARKDNVFRALELGALDFIAKPAGRAADLGDLATDLIAKVRLLARLRLVSLADPARGPGAPAPAAPAEAEPEPPPLPLRKLVVFGASTGGPPALQLVLSALDARIPAAMMVVQHMPPKFTAAFAERLDRATPFTVREARSGDLIRPGQVLVAPGALQTTVVRGEGGLRARVDPPVAGDRFVPSIDRLFESAAEAYGDAVIAVVLTGMQGEGVRGARAVAARGGVVIAEAHETALLFGMPEDVIKSGVCREVLPLGAIAGAILRRASN